jgi:hypothetical protein
MEEEHLPAAEMPARRPPWNKGKLVGAKPPVAAEPRLVDPN